MYCGTKILTAHKKEKQNDNSKQKCRKKREINLEMMETQKLYDGITVFKKRHSAVFTIQEAVIFVIFLVTTVTKSKPA